MTKRSVAVVGMGVAGLAAALRLTRGGHAVTLYERSERAGGALRSEVLEGAIVDCGVQLLSSTYRTFFRLAKEVGLGPRLVRTPGRDALWRDGRAHVMTYGSAASLATSSALPTLLKLKVASKYLPFLAGRCRGLDANDLVGTGGIRHDSASIAEWGEAALGREFVEWMAYPFLGAYYGSEPESTSAAFYHGLARIGMDVQLWGMAGGLGMFPGSVLDRLREGDTDLRFGTAVESVFADGQGAGVRTGVDERGYDAVVLAVPAQQCRKLLVEVPELAGWLSGTRTVAATALALVLSKRLRASYFGLAVPRTESAGASLVVACIESKKVAALVPPDREVVIAFPAPAVAAEMTAAPAAVVVDRLLPGLESMFGPLAESVVAAKVFRHTPGYTQFYPGYIKHLARFDPTWVPDRVALAGAWMVSPTVEGAVVSGERAADRVMQAIG